MALLRGNTSQWNHTSVVFIHGIGVQPTQYSLPLYNILHGADPKTAEATRWFEIAYDHVNQTMAEKLRIPGEQTNSKVGQRALTIGDDFLLDLVTYLFTTDIYNWINTTVRRDLVDVVQRALADGIDPTQHRVILIAHSLGTVVSYEALHHILTDPQTLGLTSGFKIQSFLTMGSPLAFIKKYQSRIPSLNDNFFLYKKPIARPTRVHSFTGASESNVLDWYNFRHKNDPVASLEPLTMATANNALSEDTAVFSKLHTGINPHDFGNYIQHYAPFIFERIHA